MRKRIEETILPVLIAVSFTFILQLVIETLTRPNGVYSIEKFSSESESTAFINVENKTNKIHDDLVFLVKNSNSLNLSAKGYLEYSLIQSNLDTSQVLLRINNILPQTKTKIVLSNLSDKTEITFANDKDKQYREVGSIISKHFNALRNAVIMTLIYGLIFGLFYIYVIYRFNQQVEKEEKYAKESKIRVQELKDELKDIREDIKKTNASSLKQKILYMAKIRDYEKELNFWKTLISRIFHDEKDINPKELFKRITETLNSYGTKSLSDEQLDMAEYISKITKE